MGLVKDGTWDRVRSIFRSFHDDIEKQEVTWVRSTGALDENYGDKEDELYTNIKLYGLVEYNFRRSWPINNSTPTGTIDGEHCRLIINKQYLNEQGYINADGYFVGNLNADKFIIAGKSYKSLGDSEASQNSTTGLFMTLILKREESINPNV